MGSDLGDSAVALKRISGHIGDTPGEIIQAVRNLCEVVCGLEGRLACLEGAALAKEVLDGCRFGGSPWPRVPPHGINWDGGGL